MLPRFASFVSVSLLALSMVACSSARVVHDTRTGGTVALRGSRDDAREKAEALMRDKCPNGYGIVEQGEVPYGESSWSQSSYHPPTSRYGSGYGVTQTRSTVQTEWRITFQCNGAQANAAPHVIRVF